MPVYIPPMYVAYKAIPFDDNEFPMNEHLTLCFRCAMEL